MSLASLICLFLLLLKETREAFDNEAKTTGRERLLFTSAVGAGKAVVDSAYDVPVMAQYGYILLSEDLLYPL